MKKIFILQRPILPSMIKKLKQRWKLRRKRIFRKGVIKMKRCISWKLQRIHLKNQFINKSISAKSVFTRCEISPFAERCLLAEFDSLAVPFNDRN
ncbi:hypothetical protein HanPI659440_Chr07g0266671 [Helianthus annuus]|nr:hypothetical protein HanPI659440_Chr07g0266671 [Helianthus annuus]